jgi:hypothetical protein
MTILKVIGDKNNLQLFLRLLGAGGPEILRSPFRQNAAEFLKF